MDPILYFFVRFGIFLFIALPACALRPLWEFCEERWHIPALTWTIAAFALAYLLAAGWFAKRTAHHYAFEKRNLYSSKVFACYDARLRLAFLPVVGHWFMPKDDKQEDDDDEADNAA